MYWRIKMKRNKTEHRLAIITVVTSILVVLTIIKAYYIGAEYETTVGVSGTSQTIQVVHGHWEADTDNNDEPEQNELDETGYYEQAREWAMEAQAQAEAKIEAEKQETIQETQNTSEISDNDSTETKVDETETEKEVDEVEYVGTVCLTFDDGPSQLTPEYLEILDEKGIKATFFITGFDKDETWKADIVKTEYEEGHTIGLHGQSHEYSYIYSSVENAVENFYLEKSMLEETVGENIQYTYIRFPGGSSNTISSKYCEGVMTEIASQLQEDGFIYYDWNVDSNDAGSDVGSSEAIYQNVIDGIKPGRTSIVLMHDSGNHSATLEALPQIIDYLLENGYEIVPITEDTPLVQHRIFN